MNPQLLLSHFDRISDAPDAIPRLRKFILDLAVRGKIVEQHANDEPPSQLLDRIQAAQARLLAEAAVKEGSSGVVSPDDIPFAVPSSWRWARLGDRLELINGRAFKPTEWLPKGLPIVRIQNLNNESAPFNYCDELTVEPRHIINSDSFLISWSGTPGTSFGAFIWRRGRAALNQHIFSCFQRGEAHFARFLQLAINGRLDEMIAKAHGGVGLQHITKGKLENLLLPIPPLPEQHRIVAKVDELMALCDQLEVAQTERESRRRRLAKASLYHLSNGGNAGDFQNHVRFYLTHLPRLTTHPEEIEALRQTILNLAVRGQLLPPANSSKRPRPLSEFAALQNGYAFKSEWFVRSGIRLLRNANVSHGVIRWNDVAFLPKSRAGEFERFQLREGDIVLSLDRPFIVSGTKVARVRPDDLPCLLLQRVGRFQVVEDRLSPDYLFLWLHSLHFTEQIDPGRSNGVPHISSKQVEAAEIFVPSLTEQYRIVEKVSGLMTLCDQLEEQVSISQIEGDHLLESVLSQALDDNRRR